MSKVRGNVDRKKDPVFSIYSSPDKQKEPDQKTPENEKTGLFNG